MRKFNTNFNATQNCNTFSERLRSARLAAGLTQAQVAAQAGGGIAGQLVSAIECGAVERIVAVLDAALAQRAQAGDPVAHTARVNLPNTWQRSELEARLDAHFSTPTPTEAL